MSSQPPSESPPASPSFFERVRDFLLGHPDQPPVAADDTIPPGDTAAPDPVQPMT